MRRLAGATAALWKDKRFAYSMVGMMLLTFITLLTRPTVGIDDTAFDVYFEDGVAPVMGRWCIFLINKLLPLAYNPYFVEWICVICLTLSVSIWCGLLAEIFGETVHVWAYTVFGCVMLSQPIYAELAPWYLQNGSAWGYGLAALAVYLTLEGLESGRRRLLGPAILVLTAAVGFYESFMIVFLMGMLLAFFSTRLLREEKGHKDKYKPCPDKYKAHPFVWFICTLAVTGGAMVVRSLIVKVLTVVFHLESQQNILKNRGLYEVLGWFDGSRGMDDLVRLFQEFVLKYYINGIVYFPVTVLVLSIGILAVVSILYGVKKRDIWIPTGLLALVLLPWMMAFLEGRASYYRSAQYISLLCGYGVFVAMWQFGQKKRPLFLKAMGVAVIGILLYGQAYDMNRWMYLDALKYEDAKRTMDGVAEKVKEICTTDKPVCVIGSYPTPAVLCQWAECPSWSRKYDLVFLLVGWMDEDLLEEYVTDYGYRYAETPALSVIQWGAQAFYGFDRELIKFWKHHGVDGLTEDGNLDHYEEAKKLMWQAPIWPGEGSVVEFSDYICVKIGEVE